MHLLTRPLLLLLLWCSLYCASESTITHSSNVSKRQLQYGDNFPLPGYQQMNASQGINAFMQSSQLLYDPGYNAQQNHEAATEMASRSANADLTTMMNPTNAAHHYQQRSQEARKFDGMANGGMGLQFEAPQTFSHIYFPHVYSPSSQHGPGRTAPHVFPGDTAAAMAARNSGQSYSTSSTYFAPLSVLYHPNVGPQQQYIHPQRPVQQQQQQQQPQQTQAYNPLLPPLPPPPPPPSPAQYQNYASQISPPLPPPPASPQSHQQQQPSNEQQQSTSQQTVYQRHSQQSPTGQTALPPPLPPLPLPRLPPLPHGQQSPQLPPPPPPPLNFQAPFRASQFLGYMPDEARGGMPRMVGGADPHAPLYTEAYPMMGAMPLQQPLVKPIYERMRENFMNDGAQQNFQQGPTAQHARYGRYIYMAPRSVYALFKAA